MKNTVKHISTFMREWWPMMVFAVLVVDILGLGAIAISGVLTHYSEAYSECVADGHKGYECQALLTGGRR